MEDPTRIPRVLATLQSYWEGQPDLHLSELWGTLENAGVVWGTTDEELLAIVEKLAATRPGVFAPKAEVLGWCRTESPAAQVVLRGTASGGVVAVRRAAGGMPGVWRYASATARVGWPLVLIDAAGTRHHLGVLADLVVGARGAEFPQLASCTDGVAFIGRRRLEVYRPSGRRANTREELPYRRLGSAPALGGELTATLADGTPFELGEILELLPMEPYAVPDSED